MYYMFLADGFEETEALVTLDMLRRAGINIKTIGVSSRFITGSHKICVQADITADELNLNNCDGLILPGGMPGTENLFNSRLVMDAVEYCLKNRLLIAAICAAPIILGRINALSDKNAVCFPGFENELYGATVLNDICVIDENIITAKGAGAVFEFSHSIISYICNKETADNIISQIQHKPL